MDYSKIDASLVSVMEGYRFVCWVRTNDPVNEAQCEYLKNLGVLATVGCHLFSASLSALAIDELSHSFLIRQISHSNKMSAKS